MTLLHALVLGNGTPLVLVHGDFADGPTAWAAQVKALPVRHRLIVPDRRGHGESPHEPRPYTFAGDAADVLETADHHGAARFHLVGHSYGALVALEMAKDQPERLLSLHLIEPPYIVLTRGEPDADALERAVGDVFGHIRERGLERTTFDFITATAGPEAAERMRGRSVWPLMVREAARIADAEHPDAYPLDAIAELRLGCPIRVYRGGRSHPVMRRIAARLAERLPGADLIDVPDAAHDVQRAAEGFDRALLSVTNP